MSIQKVIEIDVDEVNSNCCGEFCEHLSVYNGGTCQNPFRNNGVNTKLKVCRERSKEEFCPVFYRCDDCLNAKVKEM